MRLIFELLASDGGDESVISGSSFKAYSSDTSKASDASDASRESSWNLFFIDSPHTLEEACLFSAVGGEIFSKSFPSVDEALEFACSFDHSVVFYAGILDTSFAQEDACFIIGEHPDEGEDWFEIKMREKGYKMATSFPVFEHFVKLAHGSRFEGRNMLTLYHICSGNLNVLDRMIKKKYSLFERAKESIEFYIGGQESSTSSR